MEGELWGLAVHPVKPVICTGSDDGTVRLWDTDKHSMIDVVTNVGRAVRCVAFSHDGGALAIGMKDGKMDRVHVQSDHLFVIENRLCVHYNAIYLIWCNLGSFIVINTDSKEKLASFNHRKEELSDIKFSPSQTLILFSLFLSLSYVIM